MNATATRHEIRIEGWAPTPLNRLLGNHHAAARLKKLDREYVILHARLARVSRATGRRRVSLRITLPPRQRRWDPDALWKSSLDALVHANMLRDDCPKWCELGQVEYVRGAALATVIVLEEV